MRVQNLSSLLFVSLCILVREAASAEPRLPEQGKYLVGKSYCQLKIVAINDLDDVKLTDGKRACRMALASVLPFSSWPKDKDIQKLKAKFLQKLQAGLIGKKVIFHVLEIDEQGVRHGDLTLGPGKGFGDETWDHSQPSGEWGWGMTDVNKLLIERGYSPYVKRVYPHSRRERSSAGFDDAATLAQYNRAGYYSADLSGTRFRLSLSNDLTRKAEQLSNECVLPLRGLQWPQLLVIARELVKLPDAKIRHSIVRATNQFARRQSLQDQNEWSGILVARFFDEPELTIRQEMLGNLVESKLSDDKAKPFVLKVLQTETDKDMRSMATQWKKELDRAPSR